MQDLIPHSARSPEEPVSLSGSNSLLPDPLIKPERHPPSERWCHSPSSPSSPPISSSTRIRSFTFDRAAPNTRKKRPAFPYTHPPPRLSSGRRQHPPPMSTPHYGNWSSTSSNTVKYGQPEYPSGDLLHMQRRSSDGDQPSYYFASVSTLPRGVMVAKC